MNTWFQFKQFTIHQDKCAMKVCTDACLFGAWVAKKLALREIIAENILDIGCGTGLLNLMLAQKSKAEIDAVEIDEDAFKQAKDNTNSSKWSEKINIHHASIKDFQSLKKYDLIICNPPFYENQLKSENSERNMAMHATTLSYSELVLQIKKHLAPNGITAVLLPYETVKNFEVMLLNQKLFITEKLNVAHSPSHPFFRSMLLISDKENEQFEHCFHIKNNDKEYSNEFKELLEDYYLNL